MDQDGASIDYELANKIIGKKLRGLRAEQNWSREKLSEQAGIPIITIRRGESGERAVPVPVLLAWVRALGGNAADFLNAAEAEIDKTSAQREVNKS